MIKSSGIFRGIFYEQITSFFVEIFHKWNIIESEGKGICAMLKHGILGLLNYHDMTGYEVMEVFKDSLNYFWVAQTSQIYRELQGLEKHGWVNKTVVPQQGKPDKNVYSITREGKAELLRWLSESGPGLNPKTPVLMKVFFMGERSREENIEYFMRLKSECEQFLENLSQVPEYIEVYGNILREKEKAVYWQMTVDYGRRNMQMYIDWAQDCIRRLEEIENEDPGNERKSQGKKQ